LLQLAYMKTLIIGYGNPDREDDGAGWWVLRRLAHEMNLSMPSADDPLVEDPKRDLTLMVSLQLLPEMAEQIAQYERVCFVDAENSSSEQGLLVQKLSCEYKASAFTHHMRAETLLSLADELYDSRPEAILVSVKGYSFTFSNELSATSMGLAFQAVDQILIWLGERIFDEHSNT